ncbi:ATP-binding protein [Leucothrix pacifica]|uniref:AAA-ATPase-like domain-containing protein n=1 Tax=Leucothrix pacifica TaxID=1247513 RepID=A0A317CPL0_9GAMM|nr:ATP-binding protein [Leucothrix pacifica]PWR00616.1 hypothetical protein DKW60_00960 [Leucothrix pacifica]
MTRRKLPLGIQSFAKIRSDDYYYVDKTALAVKLIESSSHYFLSRPRRFGKSLFLDTLKELFEGNEPLFQGLAVHDQWDWSVKYPVLRFSFGGGDYAQPEQAERVLFEQLDVFETAYEVPTIYDTASGRLKALIIQAQKKTGQPVVVLIDEYDKPILDALQDKALSRINRDFLRGFYSTIKDSDAHLKFTFLTGVSKFSQVSLFSGLNNLFDITLDPDYSSLCGYTDHDIDEVFEPELEGLDREKIKEWYNGYNWLGQHVYNPYDVLNLFKKRIFKNYWFETGTPTFLVDHLAKNHFFSPDLAALQSDAALLSAFDIDHISNEALLFQTGYLTIHDVQEPMFGHWVYTLGYPNLEVKSSLNISLLSAYGCDDSKVLKNRLGLLKILQSNNLDELELLFHAFFASIPNQWYTKNTIAHYEGYYASVFYSYFAALGLDVTVEDSTNHGRLDMTLKFNDQVYLFEFKVVELVPDGKALQQIKDKQYADKYRGLNQPVYMIGVEFSKESRNIVGFEVEQA